jgi:hypothetical protein
MLRTFLLFVFVSYAFAKLKKKEIPSRRRLATGDITCPGANDLTVNYHTGQYASEKQWRVVVEGYTVDGVVQGVCFTGGDSDIDYEDWTTKLESEGCANGKSWHPYTSTHTVLEESQCIDMTPYADITAVKIIGRDSYGDSWDGGYITLVYNGVILRYDGPPDGTKRTTWTFDYTNPDCPTNLFYFKYTGSDTLSLDADGCIAECPLTDGDSTKRQGRSGSGTSDDCSGTAMCVDASLFFYTGDDTCVSECPAHADPTKKHVRSGSGTSDDCAGVECVDASQFIYTGDDTCVSECPAHADPTKKHVRSGTGTSDDCAGVECVDASQFIYTGTQDPSKTDTCVSECPASSSAAIMSYAYPDLISDDCLVGAVQTCTDTAGSAAQFCFYDNDDALDKEYFVIRKHPTNNCAIEPTNGEVDLSGLDTGGKPMYIAYDAFKDCTTLTSIILHPLTEVIGTYAFKEVGLTAITIPSNIIRILYGAFYKNALTSLTIPEGVTKIGNSAFAFNALTSISLPSSLTVLGSGAFLSNQLTTVTIPSGLTSLQGNTFRSNPPMGSVVIPLNIKSIGIGAFLGNSNLQLTLPIGDWNEIAELYSTVGGYSNEGAQIPGTVTGCRALSSRVNVDICPLGCTDNNYVEYDASAVLNDGSCATLSVSGGIDETNCTALKAATSTACAATPERVCVQRVVFN